MPITLLAIEAAWTIGMMRSAHHAWASSLLALASQRVPANSYRPGG
jgi:hypothetical protein